MHLGLVARRPVTQRQRHLATCFIAGLAFLAIFQWAYSSIDPALYQYRDDGIITLSHARNWVDFGFIGVNPSGERLEGTSAPLQMLLYAAAYAVTHVGYATFDQLQTLICTFALGWLIAALFAERPWFALAASVATALALTQMGSFMVWHASGMENALMHAFLLGTVVVLHRAARDGIVNWKWAVVPFLASIVRVEGIYYVAPLLAVFCIRGAATGRGHETRRFAATVGTLWIVFNLWRCVYFGALLPNTAVAQGISVGDRLLELVTLNPIYLDQSFALAKVIFARQGAYLLLLAAPLLVLRARGGASMFLFALACAVIACSLFAPFVFGQARLDTSRTTTHAAVFVMVAVAAAMYEWEPQRADRYSLPAIALVVFVIHDFASSRPYHVCCGIDGFDETRRQFEQLARNHGIARPTVANPDLGIMTWHKQFNVVDLGFLGSSIISRLRDEEEPLRRYLLDFAAPDIIESHGYWTCRYASVLADPRFTERYVFVGKPDAQSARQCKGVAVPTGVWMRRDIMRSSRSAERVLMDDLARSPTVARVQAELAACSAASPGTPGACAYVVRAVYRMLPEFRASGSTEALLRAFDASPAREFGTFVIRGAQDGKAYKPFVDYLSSAPM